RLSTAQRRGVYDLSRVNALRLPTYFRWDVRVDRTLRIADRPFTLFAGVQNLTNRRNVAEFTWSQRTNALAVSKQQGIFPIFGFDWRF
ncbi:MAG: hypothetical protein ACREEM_23840, partial [Blastocatellia bacterium]